MKNAYKTKMTTSRKTSRGPVQLMLGPGTGEVAWWLRNTGVEHCLPSPICFRGLHGNSVTVLCIGMD
jgi:hypothetical protein